MTRPYDAGRSGDDRHRAAGGRVSPMRHLRPAHQGSARATVGLGLLSTTAPGTLRWGRATGDDDPSPGLRLSPWGQPT